MTVKVSEYIAFLESLRTDPKTDFPRNLRLVGQFINMTTKTEHECLDCGHVWAVVPYSIKNKPGGCPECSINRKIKWTEKVYKAFLKTEGKDFTLKAPFVNIGTPVEHECRVCQNFWRVRPADIIHNNNGCPKCAVQKRTYSKAEYEKFLKSLARKAKSIPEFKFRTWKLVGPYSTLRESTEHECLVCGSIQKTRPESIKNGGLQCRVCKKQETNIKFRHTYDKFLSDASEVKNRANKFRNIERVGKFYGMAVATKHKCLDCNYTWKTTPQSIKNCHSGCPSCGSKVSEAHQKVCDFLSSLSLEYTVNDRTVLKNLEVDIYLPKYRLGIEVDGLYWHSEQYRDKNYHVDKQSAAKEAEITLLQFWDSEINNGTTFKVVKSMLKHRVGLSKRKFARALDVRNLSNEEASEFFKANHLQGNVGASLILGLVHKDTSKIYAAMSFGKPRFNTDSNWELLRFAVRRGYAVIGGASRLLKMFERQIQQKGNLISYADSRYSEGGVYEAIGFHRVKQQKPGYVWVKPEGSNKYIVLSRYQTQKHRLHKILGSSFSEGKSEYENMYSHGYLRVFDSGKAVYLKKVNS